MVHSLRLPDWLDRFLAGQPERFADDEAKTGLAIRLAEMNVRERSGGPFGAIWWSGVSRLVIGPRREEVVRLTGFDEGPVPTNRVELLEGRKDPLRPVRVTRDVLSDRTCAVREEYTEQGGPIYSPS